MTAGTKSGPSPRHLQLVLTLYAGVLSLLSCSPGQSVIFPGTPYVLIDAHGSWSPNRNLIAYQRTVPSSTGPAGIYTVQTDSSPPQLVAAGAYSHLAFSPDGLAIAAFTSGALVTIDIKSAAVSTLLYTDNLPVHPSWSPDGHKIVYSRGGRYVSEPADSAGLHVLDIVTGLDTALTSGGGVINGGEPTWSPEDSVIAYEGIGGIFLVAPDGGIARQLTHAPAGTRHTNPRWIASGRRLMFTVNSDPPQTWTVTMATSALTQWPFYLGNSANLSPLDTAVVVTALDPTDVNQQRLVLFLRRLDDIAGLKMRQLTSYEPQNQTDLLARPMGRE